MCEVSVHDKRLCRGGRGRMEDLLPSPLTVRDTPSLEMMSVIM